MNINDMLELVKKHENDCGSMEVQIIRDTIQLFKMNTHMKNNVHDFHNKHILQRKNALRLKKMNYLKRKYPDIHKKVLDTIKIIKLDQ